MKRYFTMLMFLAFGCNGTGNPVDSTEKIIGTWQLEATKISPGGPVDWTEVTSGANYVFKTDGSFTYQSPENINNNKSGTFRITDGELQLMYTKNDQEIVARFQVQMLHGKLILQFTGCIEECRERYRRI